LPDQPSFGQLFRDGFALQAVDDSTGNNLRHPFQFIMKPQRSSTMKRFISYLAINMVLFAFAFAQSPIAQQPANSTSEQEVKQMIEKYRSAILRRDVATLEEIWADDYVFVNAAGDVLTKTDRLANIKSGATTLDSIKEEEHVSVRVYQNSAVVTSRVTLKGQYSGQPISGQYRSTLVLVKGSGGWQLVSNQLTALKLK
jgi:ketosteroid isomerase-like protein